MTSPRIRSAGTARTAIANTCGTSCSAVSAVHASRNAAPRIANPASSLARVSLLAPQILLRSHRYIDSRRKPTLFRGGMNPTCIYSFNAIIPLVQTSPESAEFRARIRKPAVRDGRGCGSALNHAAHRNPHSTLSVTAGGIERAWNSHRALVPVCDGTETYDFSHERNHILFSSTAHPVSVMS